MQIKDYLKEHEEEFKPWLVNNEQGRVEIKVLPYLQDIEDGFFIEAGAADGLFQSNTLILEDLGWKGILVEPSQASCSRCEGTRTALIYNTALVSKYYDKPRISGDFFFDGYMGSGAYSSVTRKVYKPEKFPVFEVSVPACTLDFILTSQKIDRVDFLSLDVEGYEMEVIKGIDFNKTYIKYMLIEINTREYTLEAMEDYLKPFGYAKGINISNFTFQTNPGWPGDHQDFLFICKS